jgi:hypothetical protein
MRTNRVLFTVGGDMSAACLACHLNVHPSDAGRGSGTEMTGRLEAPAIAGMSRPPGAMRPRSIFEHDFRRLGVGWVSALDRVRSIPGRVRVNAETGPRLPMPRRCLDR